MDDCYNYNLAIKFNYSHHHRQNKKSLDNDYRIIRGKIKNETKQNETPSNITEQNIEI